MGAALAGSGLLGGPRRTEAPDAPFRFPAGGAFTLCYHTSTGRLSPPHEYDFKSSVYALCYRKSCWNASRAMSAVRETDSSGM